LEESKIKMDRFLTFRIFSGDEFGYLVLIRSKEKTPILFNKIGKNKIEKNWNFYAKPVFNKNYFDSIVIPK